MRCIFGLLLGLAAISGLTAPPAVAGAGSVIAFATVAQGSQSAIRQPLETVVHSEGVWQALWQRHTAGRPHAAPAPAVDFWREMVVAVFGGETESYVQVAVLRIVQADGGLSVQVLIRRTQPGPALAGVEPATPFHIVRLPRSPLPVTFERIMRPDFYQQPGS